MTSKNGLKKLSQTVFLNNYSYLIVCVIDATTLSILFCKLLALQPHWGGDAKYLSLFLSPVAPLLVALRRHRKNLYCRVAKITRFHLST